jgi:alpha,alpha-trehalase
MSHQQSVVLKPDFDAFIFDLDGVVTRTASVHAAAWKRLFDDYLRACARREKRAFEPFDAGSDYLQYVDGKPRYEGVRSFLESRHIDLPFGDPSDDPERETICGLGNRKNALLLEQLERGGVEAYASTVRLIGNLRAHGIKTAVVSASKNCAAILDAAGLSSLFDARVDGVVAAERGLAGKPAPDTFLEAARGLGVQPDHAVVVEDAIAGVQAGARGGFGLVLGVDRAGQGDALKENGADVVVEDLSQISLRWNAGDAPSDEIPSALERGDEIAGRLKGKCLAVFLDYDGTLTPIVERPDQALLSEEMRETLSRLASRCTVAVVSGRDLQDVCRLVDLDSVFCAGCHGFDIAGPEGRRLGYQEGVSYLPEIDRAERDLRRRLGQVTGVLIERKKFSVAVHYRLVREPDLDSVHQAVEQVLAAHPALRKLDGKKVHDIQPDIEWDKGKAVLWLLRALDLDGENVVPLYIGDDVTDYDAFRALKERGVGIMVGSRAASTGAQYALNDPGEVRSFLERLVALPECQTVESVWSLVWEGFDPDKEGLREALCTLGNGYFATRGAAPEADAGDVHYPGTYFAGGYNRVESPIAGRVIENEDLVNFPNWLCLTFRCDEGDWFDLRSVELLSYQQKLDMRRGVLHRSVRFRDVQGRETLVTSRRFVHTAYPHLAGLETTIVPQNWSGRLWVRSALDGRVTNDGVKRYREINSRHLGPVEAASLGEDSIYLQVETNQSRIRVAEVARTQLFREGELLPVEPTVIEEPGYIAHEMSVDVLQGTPLTIEKVVAVFTSRDPAISECGLEARRAIDRVWRFDSLLESHASNWSQLWHRCGITVSEGEPRTMLILHLHIFHLLQTVSAHIIDLDVGVPARGLHGEAYRGHIFWDELFIFPLLNFRCPEITRALLGYRYRRLGEARRAAKDAGFRGAMYPWQSGSNGREESQKVHLNPKSRRWIADNSVLQRHINAAVAYNTWQYFQVTCDREFLAAYGAEMILEIARFFADLATYSPQHDRYEILGVMGPDEYHDAYPEADRAGLDNNAYTNAMAAWVLWKALEVLELLSEDRREELCTNLALGEEEVARWEQVSRKMRICFGPDGVISQFEGYDKLQEFDWEGYRNKHGDIMRLDRLLEAEGDTPNRYRLSKQADVLMLFYLFSAEELRSLFERLGYPFEYGTIPKTIDYYLERTCHGSTLSYMVHSWVLARSDRARSWSLLRHALESDIADVQGGTTQEGIHLGAMAGTIDIIQRAYTGLEVREDVLWLNPLLPDNIRGLSMRIHYRGHWLDIDVSQAKLSVALSRGKADPIKVGLKDAVHVLEQGSRIEVAI